MGAGRIGVSFELRGSACVIGVHGELTVPTSHEFTGQVTMALAALGGPVLFDVSGLDFVDCHGARVLARELRAVSARGAGLYGCRPVVRRFFELLGFDLPYVTTLTWPVPVPASLGPVGPAARGQDLTALIRVTQATARQSVTEASVIMSRLATTYAELALNSRYRTARKSEDRGRLLALSGRARDLSQPRSRPAARDAG
ncbi:MAG: anti-sigma factor antagonist [Actinobacteria bacterium]|nr:anti-sigma factor antagonist [Actinomycetota bacterium]